MTLEATRQCHNALNPLHSLIYFAPEAEREYTAIGLEPGGMGYFASRAAAMGAVGPGTVAAAFYNFNPALIARFIPRAWQAAAPEAVLDARLRAVEAALTRVLGADAADDPEVAEAAALATTAVEACAVPGRPLYGAHADLDIPKSPQAALWHCGGLLREHRGDGHVTALAAAGLDGLEALITHTATGTGSAPEFARATRGWSQEEWDAGCERLRERGLLDADGALTPAGTALRQEIEDTTDRLAADPYRHLGEAGTARLTEIASRLTRAAAQSGAFPAGLSAPK
ncbi:SCO6745 family protein [Actinacidiphila sp. bgisy144]|uniref:SCO6745 family protein n=1 Tax=unclassified Actinacidiphila TaxID=2995708 RepID=UPI003EB90474